MKRFIFGFLAIFFLIFNILPSVYLFADEGYSNTQYSQVGSILFSNLITSGEATELDFSDYTGSGTDLLIALGEMAVTGDVTGLVEYGLDWLADTTDDIYQNAIESIRECVYNISPDLYNWWYNGSQYEYKLEPVKASGLALRQLLTPPNNQPTPQPSPDFSFISNINNIISYNSSHNILLTDNTSYLNGNDYYDRINSGSIFSHSFINMDSDGLNHVNQSSGSEKRNKFGLTNNIITVYVVSSNNTYTVSYSPFQYIKPGTVVTSNNSTQQNLFNTYNGISFSSYYRDGSYYGSIVPFNDSYITLRNSFDSLSVCINYLYKNLGNINLYVDGQLWVSTSNVIYPITIDDLLTVLNNQPAIYNYPDNTYIDLSNLQSIITDAIDNSDVLTYNDIKPVFVDVNGQEAVAVVQIYRNDYDDIYPEQLPLIILPNDENYFSVHLLDTSKQYLQTQVDVVENTVDVLPSHLVGVLAIGCILTIFACIIHRLLE